MCISQGLVLVSSSKELAANTLWQYVNLILFPCISGCDDIHTMIERMQGQAAEIEAHVNSVSVTSTENAGKVTTRVSVGVLAVSSNLLSVMKRHKLLWNASVILLLTS